MIAPWMLYSVVLGVMMAGAAWAIDRIAATWRLPSRWGWVVALVAMISVPALVAMRPAPPIRAALPIIRGGAVTGQRAATAVRSSALSPRFDLRRLDRPLLGLWIAASSVLLLGLLAASLAQHRRRQEWSHQTVDGVRVLIAPDAGPAVLGLIQLDIVLPQWALDGPDAERRLILAHEVQHREARDPNLLLFGALAVALAPWSPALWWVVRRLRLALEVDCDQRVLKRGGDAHAYGALLLNVGFRFARQSLAPGFFETSSLLERRIEAMTSPKPNHPVTRAALFAGVATLIVGVACRAPRPDPVAPSLASDQLFSPDAIVPGHESVAPSVDQMRNAIRRYYPEVLRGVPGDQPLVFVVDAEGRVAGTTRSAGTWNLEGAWTRLPGIDPAREGLLSMTEHPAGSLTDSVVKTVFIRLIPDSIPGSSRVLHTIEQHGSDSVSQRMNLQVVQALGARSDLRGLLAGDTAFVWLVFTPLGEVVRTGRAASEAENRDRTRVTPASGFMITTIQPRLVSPAAIRVAAVWEKR